MKSISNLFRKVGQEEKRFLANGKRNFSSTFLKYDTFIKKEIKRDPKINLLDVSKKVVTKSSIGRVKTRITAVDLPKRNKLEEKKWPKCSATLRQCPGSPHRLMQIADYVRGLSARQALKDLEVLNRRQAIYVYKLIQSAMFNGENNAGLNAERLVIHEIFVTKGRTRKRLRIQGRGHHGIQITRWSHMTVILMEVPEQENERRLGSRGWTNKKWEEYYQSQMNEPLQEEQIKEEVKMKEETTSDVVKSESEFQEIKEEEKLK